MKDKMAARRRSLAARDEMNVSFAASSKNSKSGSPPSLVPEGSPTSRDVAASASGSGVL